MRENIVGTNWTQVARYFSIALSSVCSSKRSMTTAVRLRFMVSPAAPGAEWSCGARREAGFAFSDVPEFGEGRCERRHVACGRVGSGRKMPLGWPSFRMNTTSPIPSTHRESVCVRKLGGCFIEIAEGVAIPWSIGRPRASLTRVESRSASRATAKVHLRRDEDLRQTGVRM
jgi:hypothetical protein